MSGTGSVIDAESLAYRRFLAGLCPECGERFGQSGADEARLSRVSGSDPKVLAVLGPYVELVAPCGHVAMTVA